MRYKMTHKTVFVIFLLSALFLCGTACAREPVYPSRPEGYVSDFANIIRSSDRERIESLARSLEAKTTAQLAVVTVKTVTPETIDGYAVTLFERWGIGQRGKDNGVLLVIAYQDRKLRIETGYGLEGALPDVVCSNIIQRIIVPQFKQGKFSEGTAAGAAAIVSLIAKEYNVEITGREQMVYQTVTRKESALAAIFRFIFTLFFFMILLSLRLGFLPWFFLLSSGRRRGGYWYGGGFGGSSGGFGGGFGGFGGGLSGGGGSSGGW